MTHAVVAEHVSKTYRLHRERRRTLKEVVLRQYAPADDVEALRDVSFTVDAGKAFGIVGSTVLASVAMVVNYLGVSGRPCSRRWC